MTLQPRRQALTIIFLASLGVAVGERKPVRSVSGAPADAHSKAADFARDGFAFVQQHCLACHGANVQKAGLSLHTYRDEPAIMKNRKTWQNVLHMVRSGEMPPEGRPRLPAADVEKFLKALQGIFERHARPDPGHVTIRRLNRTEYNNTIRDLLGLDSRARTLVDNFAMQWLHLGRLQSFTPDAKHFPMFTELSARDAAQ